MQAAFLGMPQPQRVVNAAAPRENIKRPRIASGISFFDNALDGGIVLETSLVVAGAPGSGKSTFLLQVANGIALTGRRVLYASSEESEKQLLERMARLRVAAPSLDVLATKSFEEAQSIARNYEVGVFDSIQEFHQNTNKFLFPATRLLASKMNASGSVKGTTDNEHDCDCLVFVEQADASPKHFEFRPDKDRNGSAATLTRYQLKAHGAETYEPPQKKKKGDKPHAVPFLRKV